MYDEQISGLALGNPESCLGPAAASELGSSVPRGNGSLGAVYQEGSSAAVLPRRAARLSTDLLRIQTSDTAYGRFEKA
jgi:hypothetical protein